jgi:hypothetical protein
MSSNDGGIFGSTNDGTDPWDWINIISRLISQAAIQIGVAVLAGGFAIAGSLQATHEGVATLEWGASAFFTAWFVISSVMTMARRR